MHSAVRRILGTIKLVTDKPHESGRDDPHKHEGDDRPKRARQKKALPKFTHGVSPFSRSRKFISFGRITERFSTVA